MPRRKRYLDAIESIENWVDDNVPILNTGAAIRNGLVLAMLSKTNKHSSGVLANALSNYLISPGETINSLAHAKQYPYDVTNPEQYIFLNKQRQKEEMLKAGYKQGRYKDYPLFKKELGDKVVPVYQQSDDSIARTELTPIGNGYNDYYGPINTRLVHPNNYPTTTYIDNDGKFYQKAWDYNNYGGHSLTLNNVLGNIIDAYGNPFVVTTGYQPVVGAGYTSTDVVPYTNDEMFFNVIEPKLRKVPNYNQIMKSKYNLLPEIVVTPRKRSIKTTKGK